MGRIGSGTRRKAGTGASQKRPDPWNLLTTAYQDNGTMHRLASCPGVDPPEDVVLVEQPAADV